MALCLDDVVNGRGLLQWCKDGGPLPRQPAKIVTAADGRFRLGGIGPDTVVELHVRGPGIHHTTFEATTAVSDTVRGPVPGADSPLRARPARVLYGANCENLATPARTIAGVVRDLATGEPVAGANVRSTATTFMATTDREGRYELLGCKKEADYRIRVQPPGDGPAYFFAEAELADAPGLGPLVQDIGLARGIAMQGHVVDSVTGLPLPTRVHYEPLPRNVHVAALVERPADLNGYADCRADGTWRIVVAAGPGALRFGFPGVDPECYAPITVTYEELVKLYEQSPEHSPLAHLPEVKEESRFSHVIGSSGSARVVLISPVDGAAPEPLEVQLERGRTLGGQVVGPDGKPLAGVTAYGLNNWCIGSQTLRSGEFAVTALRPGVRRELGFHHKEKRLGAYRVIDGGESERLVVPLEPCGAAVGRILDEHGAPFAAMDVWFYSVGAKRGSEAVFAVTDANGRFRTNELVPGQPYEVDRSGPGSSVFRSLYGGGFSVGSGQTKDLGDFTLGGKPKPVTKADTDDQSDANEKPKSPPPRVAPKGGDDGIAATKASEAVTVRGRVLDPQGKPLAGAKLYLSYPNRKALEPQLLGNSGAEGQFEFRVDKLRLDTSYMPDPWSMASITATAEGFGLEWVDAAKPDGDGNLIVRLVNDVPIHGRVLTLEGKPVAEAKIRLRGLKIPEQDLDAYVEFLRTSTNSRSPAREQPRLPDVPDEVLADDEGRFTLRGFGAERVVELSVEGPGIEWWFIRVMTRECEPVVTARRGRPDRVYGATFDYLAPISRPIVGTVRDRATGDPVAGATIRGRTQHVPKSDENGRFELLGCAKAEQYTLRVVPDGLPYFTAGAQLVDTPGFEPLEADFQLERGIRMTGRVTTQPSGAPSQAYVEYFPLRPNQHVAKLPADRARHHVGHSWADCRPDGSYTLAVLPGPGVLAFRGHVPDYYRLYAPALITRQDIAEFFHRSADEFFHPSTEASDHASNTLTGEYPKFLTVGPGREVHVLEQATYNQFVLIDPPEAAETLTQDATLEVGRTVPGSVRGPDGEPLAGARVGGLDNSSSKMNLETPDFTVLALNPRRRRLLVFEHRERRLGFHTIIAGDDPGPLAIRMQPCGTVVGRLLDPGGTPLASRPILGAANHVVWPPEFTLTTDGQGRFRLEGMVPGLEYYLYREYKPDKSSAEICKFTVAAGETKDLGDVTTKSPAAPPRNEQPRLGTEQPGQSKPKVESQTKQPERGQEDRADGAANAPQEIDAKPKTDPADDSVTVRGRVQDPDGKPLAGAKLYLSYPNRKALEPQLLGTSGAEGRFEFRVDKSRLDTSYMPNPWSMASITATAEGFGLEWVDAAKPDGDGNLTIHLVNDVPIHGRVLTLEGKPVAGAKVRLRQISIPERNLDAFIEGLRTGAPGGAFQRVRAKLPGVPDEIVADAEGRCTLSGLGAERLVELAVEAPGIEWASIRVMTRECEPVVRAPGAQMSPLPDRAYGATFDYLAAPARPIVGTVRDHETGEPVVGAKVRGRNMNFSKTDEEGRFALLGEPKVKRHFVEVIPGGLPYFAASLQIDDTPGFEPLTVEFTLLRGITARGRVTAQPSGAPNQAQVDYYPLLPNEHIAKLGTLPPGGHGRSSTECGPDGAYTLPVLPGPGVLAFRAGPVSPDYYRLYSSALITPRDLEEFFHKDAGQFFRKGMDPDDKTLPASPTLQQSMYNQLVLINPAEDAQELTQDATIEVGRTVAGRVEGPDREPLAGVLVRGLDNSLSKPERLETPEFTVLALNPRRRRVLIFEHRERRLGFHLDMAGDEPGPLVVGLQSCGAVVGRLLDAEGEPLAGSVISVGRHRIASPEFTVKTDPEGRFRAEGLVPGLKYDLLREREPGIMGIRFVADGVAVAAGETKDLGDRAIKPPATPPRNEKPKPGTEQPGQLKPNDESQPKPPQRAEGDNPGAANRKIVGTIRDLATGKPIAAVKVVFQDRLAGGFPAPLGGSAIASEDETDDQGRYELVEVAKGKQYSVMVLPEGLPYFGASAQLADAPGTGPLTADFELRSGIPAQGRVTVRPTGEPNQARVEYFPLKPNVHVGGLGPFEREQPWASATCRADGSYSVPVLPGPGVLAFRAAPLGQDDRPFYAQAFVTPQDLVDFFHLDADKFYYEWHSSGVNQTLPVASERSGNWAELLQTRYHQLVLINPGRDAESLTQDATFEVGRTIAGSVQGPDGEPLAGATVIGLDDVRVHQTELATPKFTVLAIHPRRTRNLVFTHRGRNLGTLRIVEGDEPGPLIVRLGPCGSVVGRLIDPAGQPLAKTPVALAVTTRPTVMTDDEGKFRIDGLVPGRQYSLLDGHQVVGERFMVAAGETKEVGDLKAEARAPPVTREPLMVRGRVLDLEGRPAVGAKVRAGTVHVPVAADGGSLDHWLAAVRDAKDFQDFNRAHIEHLSRQIPRPHSIDSELLRYPFVTDGDGRFEFDAGGAERVLNLIIEGNGLASTYCQVMTRPGAPIHVPAHSRDDASMYLNPLDDVIDYGATFEHVATPGCRIEGVVRDRATGEPVAGVTVRAERRNELDGALGRFRSTTDTLGRYQLFGVPTRVKPTPMIAVSGPEVPYLAATLEADLEHARDVVKLDFAMARGVWVEGRVTDKETGEGVQADVMYFVWADDPLVQEKGRSLGQDAFQVKTTKDGAYRVLAFPGRGVIAVRANPRNAFGIGSAAIEGRKNFDGSFSTNPSNLRPDEFNALAAIEPTAGAESVHCDVQVDPGLRRTGTVVDSDGQPLEGAQWRRGLMPSSDGSTTLEGPQFTVEHLAPGETRMLLFEHQARRLIVLAKIAAEGDDPLVVALGPWATVSGRVVGEDGEPRTDVQVVALEPPIPQVKVSQDGRFTIERLIPGVKYQFRPSVRNRQASLPLARDVVLKPGETRDLGDVVMKSQE